MALNPKKLHIFNLLVKILPPSRFSKFKVRVLRWCGATVGRNVSIFSPKILGDFNLIIGDKCWLGHDALIFGAKGSKIIMEDNSKVASKAILVTGYHKYGLEYDCIAGPGLKDDIVIKKGALIGTAAMVTPGKTIGVKSHVAAMALVTKDVPAHVRVGGIPAKIIKNFEEE